MKKIFLLVSLLIVLFVPTNAQAEEVDLNEFANLPILHEGRVKPIDSFARIYLDTFSEQSKIKGTTPIEWLAESIFTPDIGATRPIFKVRDWADFNLEERPKNLYTYLEITALIQSQNKVIIELMEQDEASWSLSQKHLMTLYEHYILHTQILRSLTAILPLNIDDTADKTYLDYKDTNSELAAGLRRVIGVEENINTLLRVIPTEDDQYISPWQIVKQDKIDQLNTWLNITNAYRNKNIELWDNTFDNIDVPTRVKIETYFNNINFIGWALALYIIAFFLIIARTSLAKRYNLNQAITVTLFMGALVHFIHLMLRIYILERAPVGTLYESILFVSFGCVIAALLIEWRQKNGLGALIGSISGALLLITANSFAPIDNMSTLVAVLNTNFWLYTHVLCITLGYSWCFITSLLAHFYLAQKAFFNPTKEKLKSIETPLKSFVILSLLFTTIGTILGGIWADQSWGRFWGWDPKENGALLIVLWLVWLLHGRISKHISKTGYIVGCALLSIIVTLAWFGVNLLSVGLHSYGFISGIAWSIAGFTAFELILVSFLYWRGRKA